MTLGIRVLRSTAVLAALAGVLAGCKNSSQAGGPGAGGTTSPSAGAAAPSGAAPAASSGPGGSCTGTGNAPLRSVSLTADASGLTATWTSTGTDKAATAIWVVTVSGGAPNDYQLTVKATSGVAQSYVFNVDTSAQTAVHQPGDLTITPGGATESFPWSDLPGIGSEFTWNAILNIDGGDDVYCPADMTFLDFKR